MGSKGSNTTTTNQSQTYTANPLISGAAGQAIGMAQNAASQPFNMPVAPVAGFNATQQQAFNQLGNLQGMAQPYYNQAQNYLQQSATPLTASQINNYYNPMASNVLANLQETQGQQMQDLTGRLTQQAGGVGADRIAVGQSELARQQNLATGQTLSGLYQNALNAAQQNQQMQANAAYGLTNLGTTAQGAALQGTQALLGAGNQQQGLSQSQLNAQYQNQLAQLAYPFQTAQYLAGITGGLSGALGGTTTGQGTTTQPAPSIWSQILGGVTGGVGLAGATGAFGNNGWLTGSSPSYGGGNAFSGDAYGGSASNPLPGLSASDYGYADGGSVEGDSNWMSANPYIPMQQVRSQSNPGAHLDLSPKTQQSNSSGGIGDALKAAASIAPFFMASGGAVDASNPWQHFADGGSPDFDTRFNDAAQMGEMTRGQALNHYLYPTNDGIPNVVNPNEPYRLAGPEAMQNWRNGNPLPSGANDDIQPLPDDTALAVNNAGAGANLPLNAMPTSGDISQTPIPSAKQNGLPYGDLNPTQDASREFARSPWLALANAGFGMMAGTSPFAGVNIGKGFQEGIKTLEQQRKDLATEEGVNQRAQQLIQQAEFHLDQYNKMTPYQQAQIANQKERTQMLRDQMNIKGWVKGSENTITGDTTWTKPATGEFKIIKGNGEVITGNMNDPSTVQRSSVNGMAKGEQGSSVSKDEQPPPPMGMKELSSDLQPPENNVNQAIYRKGSPALTAANAELKAQAAANVKEANLSGPQQQLLEESKRSYGVLMKDNDADGFLTKIATLPGNNFDERIRYARSLNGAAQAAGKAPPVDPDKLAAMEVISKVQRTMGMMFAGNISAREAWAGQQAAIESTPGLTQSRLGMLHLISTFDAMNQYGRDRRAFFDNYIQKYGVATGWQEAFQKQNPIERYVVRSTMENLPNRQAAAKLPQAVEILRAHKNDPAVVKAFNQNYGNTASYWLTGKLDTLGAQ